MGLEALKQQLAKGEITQEQFAAEVKKLLDEGSITQEEHDAALKADPEKDKPLTAAEIQAMIQAASQKEADRVRTEYARKLKDAEAEAERLKLEKMSDEDKAKFEKEKLENDLKDREQKLLKREIELHTNDQLREKQLPLDFRPFLAAGSVEDTNANIAAFETAWSAAIKAAVDMKFKENGGNPPGGKGGKPQTKKWSEMTLTEQGKLYKEDPAAAKALAAEAGVVLS